MLGFSALQLSHEAPDDEWTLERLVAADALSKAPATPPAVPGNAVTRDALGYMHANCGHCHNQKRPASDGPRCFDPDNSLDFWLTLDHLQRPESTPIYETAVGSVIERGRPEKSKVIELVSRRGHGLHMPPLATETVDEEAVANLSQWIRGMPED